MSKRPKYPKTRQLRPPWRWVEQSSHVLLSYCKEVFTRKSR